LISKTLIRKGHYYLVGRILKKDLQRKGIKRPKKVYERGEADLK